MPQHVEHIETALNFTYSSTKTTRNGKTWTSWDTQHITYTPYPEYNIRDHQIRNEKLHK